MRRQIVIVGSGAADRPSGLSPLHRGCQPLLPRRVTGNMKLAAAQGLAALVEDHSLRRDHINPAVFDPRVVPAVAAAVAKAVAAERSGTPLAAQR